jgi:hypothetical protein
MPIQAALQKSLLGCRLGDNFKNKLKKRKKTKTKNKGNNTSA